MDERQFNAFMARFAEMLQGVRQYIGARYVPNFLDDPWNDTTQYEALDVVNNGTGTSYIAKKPVPAGTPLSDREFWFVYGSTSGAIINLQNQIDDIIDDIKVISYNVKDFGALGDGLTDDTDAINNLINTIPDGSTLYFPEGTYLIREVRDSSISGNGMSTHLLYEASLGIHIQNRNNITIKGSGNKTIFKGIDPVGCCYGNIINIENCNGIVIKDLTIYGNLESHVNVCNTGNLKDEWIYGIHLWKDTINCLIDNVTCLQCHSDGINLHDDYQRYMINVHIRDCTFNYCGRNGIQCGKCKFTFINNCKFDNMTGAQTTGCAIDCEAHDYVTENIYITNCTWTNTRQGVAFNTIKNAIVSDCYGDTIWNQSRKVYHDIPFDRGFGVIFNNIHGVQTGYITDGTEIHNCNIARLTVYSNLDGNQNNDRIIIDGCSIDILAFYGNFDGYMLISNNTINYIDIEPNYSVNGLNIINNTIRKIALRMAGDVVIANNLIIGDYDENTFAIRTLGTGTHKLIGNTIKVANRASTQQINLAADAITIADNVIEDRRNSGITVVGTAPKLDVINNYIDSSGSEYAIQIVCSGTPLVDGNITKSVKGIIFSSGTNPTDAINRNYNI